MNGTGNDFLLIDNRESQVSLSREQIAHLCHRQRGIGADGLIYLRIGKESADWAWEFYNADGSDAEMCGNGARCFAKFIQISNINSGHSDGWYNCNVSYPF